MNPVYKIIAWAALQLGGPDLMAPEVQYYLMKRQAVEEAVERADRYIDLEWERALRRYPLLPPPPMKP